MFHRLGVRMSVRYTITTRHGEVCGGDGSTINLSAGGLLLAIASVPQAAISDLLEGVGSIDVAFALAPGEPEIVSRCRLVWMQGPRRPGEGFELGVRFVDLDAATRERIFAFVIQVSV